MKNNHSLKVIDINPGIGGRSFVFTRMGCKVIAALETDPKLNKIFSQINPDIDYLPFSSFSNNICSLFIR